MTEITKVAVFKRIVLNGVGLRIVRFCAEWSGPCHIMGPIYEEMSVKYQNSAAFFQIDIDKVPALKKEYGITELPTILIYREGLLIDYIAGLISRKSLIEKMEKRIIKK